MAADTDQRSFLQRSNDLDCRDFSCRAFRFLRARVRAAGRNAILLADEPRVVRAWKNGWEVDHYARLLHWRDEGFRPQVIYDIGAHRGLWSEMAQNVFSPRQCVLFEPQREPVVEIKSRQARCGGNWRLFSVALGDRVETKTIHVNLQSAASSLLPPQSAAPKEFWGGGELRAEEISVAALDGVVAAQDLPPPDLIKLDVQGYEAKVLAGGRRTITQAARLVVEVSLRPIYEGQVLLPEILTLLTDWGFVLEDVNEALRRWPRGGLWQMDIWLKNSTADGARGT